MPNFINLAPPKFSTAKPISAISKHDFSVQLLGDVCTSWFEHLKMLYSAWKTYRNELEPWSLACECVFYLQTNLIQKT